MFTAPNARYRLYTRPNSYVSFFRDVMSGRFRKGEDVNLLEARAREFLSVKNVVAMPMARVGIYLALKSLIPRGSQVIMSPYTIADVVNMVISAGGRPVFADISPESCNIDPNEVERLIDKSTGAVLITHLHGLSADAKAIKDICDAYNVPMVEDSAQAFGAMQDGVRVGTVGRAGIFSLGTYKNINCWFGGLVVTDDDDLAATIRSSVGRWKLQTPGFVFKKLAFGLQTDVLTLPPIFSALTYWIFRFGALHDVELINRFVRTELDTSRYDEFPEKYRARLSPFQARLALPQIDNIDTDSDIRIAFAKIYHSVLQDQSGLRLPPLREDRSHIYTYFPVQHDDNDALVKSLMKQRRDVGIQHLKNCADLDSFAEFQRNCPNARRVAKSVVLLPTYPRYGEKEVRKTADAVLNFFGTGDLSLSNDRAGDYK